ncbi:MAG: asparagine synthase (glutamine-hydrolyzing), partial [Acidobacteria bacterium]
MCSIAGIVYEDGSQEAAMAAVRRMIALQRHRGPDGVGFYDTVGASLGHCRLAIIDLSDAGHQPMADLEGRYWITFNGEIYNHRELRHDLKVRGHVFKGHSDTEVLPHLYEEEGPEFVSKLRGMFALAIYDARTRTLLLARDRFGIKPLFYAPGKDRLSFASEIRPLLELPGIDTRPDKQAIYDFAALFYVPAPETFYVGIRALQPGELLEAQLNRDGVSWKTRTYYLWSITPDPTLTLDQATERANEFLTTAVQRQLESEVPLGSLLSGGIDSSLVSVAAQTALDGELRTFNVRFPEKEYDETWAATAVAEHIGSRHETLDMNGVGGTWEHVTSLLSHAGQPFADTSLFAVNAVCRLMRRHVTVALSGDGGDEGFAGYDSYWRIARIAKLQRLAPPIWRTGAVGLAPLGRLGIVPDSLPQRIRDLAGADNTAIIQALLCWVREEEHKSLCRIAD